MSICISCGKKKPFGDVRMIPMIGQPPLVGFIHNLPACFKGTEPIREKELEPING